jgi:hypothetical protein
MFLSSLCSRRLIPTNGSLCLFAGFQLSLANERRLDGGKNDANVNPQALCFYFVPLEVAVYNYFKF